MSTPHASATTQRAVYTTLPPIPLPQLLQEAQPASDDPTISRGVSIARDVKGASSHLQALLDCAVRSATLCEKAWGEMDREFAAWDRRLDGLKKRFGGHVNPRLELLQLLLTGKASDAVESFFAGNNMLTERNLVRWETTVLSALRTVRITAVESLFPACEQILLLLDELKGCSLWPMRYERLSTATDDISSCLNLTTKAAETAVQLDDLCGHEQVAFGEFAKWLRYELKRVSAAETQNDERPSANHDVLTVAEYLARGFENHILSSHLAPPSSDTPSAAGVDARPPSTLVQVVRTLTDRVNSVLQLVDTER